MNILTSFTHPRVISNFLSSAEHKIRHFEERWEPSNIGTHWLPLYGPNLQISSFMFHRRKSYGFETTWGWVNDDSSCVFGWTITLRINFVSDASPNISKNESVIDIEEEHREIKWTRLDSMRNICIHAESFAWYLVKSEHRLRHSEVSSATCEITWVFFLRRNSWEPGNSICWSHWDLKAILCDFLLESQVGNSNATHTLTRKQSRKNKESR